MAAESHPPGPCRRPLEPPAQPAALGPKPRRATAHRTLAPWRPGWFCASDGSRLRQKRLREHANGNTHNDSAAQGRDSHVTRCLPWAGGSHSKNETFGTGLPGNSPHRTHLISERELSSMNTNRPMHECANMVWGPVILWTHMHEFLDPFITQTEIKATRCGRWAHASWPPNTLMRQTDNADCVHMQCNRKQRDM